MSAFPSDEAFEKLRLGMKILIREGSAAKNFDALIDLLPEHFRMMMFCSDDKHPNDLIQGHINQLVARAIARGCELFDVLQVACVNPRRTLPTTRWNVTRRRSGRLHPD